MIDSSFNQTKEHIYRIVYELTVTVEHTEAAIEIEKIAQAELCFGWLDSKDDALCVVLEGTPLAIGEFITYLHLKLPKHIKMQELKIVDKKKVSSFSSNSFTNKLSNSSKQNKEFSNESIAEFCDTLIAGDILSIPYKSDILTFSKVSSFSPKSFFKILQLYPKTSEYYIVINDMQMIFDYCAFSPDIVKSLVADGVAFDLELLDSIKNDSLWNKFFPNDKINAILPSTEPLFSICKAIQTLNAFDEKILIAFN